MTTKQLKEEMELPDNIMSVVPPKPRHRYHIKVKTFVFSLEQVKSGTVDTDGIVNDFTERHNVLYLACERYGHDIVYRVTYRERAGHGSAAREDSD